MIAQVTAAALASDNKALAHPASVDSLPTSANQEDHVSMAPNAGKRLWYMADNVRGILAVEWLGACQGLDFREGLKARLNLNKLVKSCATKFLTTVKTVSLLLISNRLVNCLRVAA